MPSSLQNVFPLTALLSPQVLQLQQQRGRKRALKANLSRQQKLERRLKREAKEAARKQYNFMERLNIRRMKNLLSPSQQFPGRLIREDEEGLPDKPTTNVYISTMLKTQFHPIPEALAVHRCAFYVAVEIGHFLPEMQQPSIYNNPKAPIRLRIELNMNTERQTKMVPNSDEIVPVPYQFVHNEKRTILAFARDPKLQELAVESGAEIALGPEMIKKIIKGQFRTDDYDFCVAHVDMGPSILPLRGILKTRFPTKLNGGLGEDLPDLIQMFKNGVKVNIRGDPVYPVWGLCNVVVGRLSMPDEEIEANIGSIIKAICKHRNPALGPFINRALMMVIPGDMHLAIDIDKFLPVATPEEIEKVNERMSKHSNVASE
ncbi:unnamed protein product [Anisakis simplex]|uniref:39S ribosomal protein L1, mitochondrial (inferred by orthology to a human protein) n=1 Tax=Anisakis simplex TaxID=6269 RepID=A0A0M3JYH2_ANISI|nr:unnamed protein product [Anisakis simplex]